MHTESKIEEIANGVNFLKQTVRKLVHASIEQSRPKAQSTATERLMNQDKFKSALIQKYMPNGPLHCMVTGAKLKRNKLIAAHIVGLSHLETLAKLNLRYEDLWSERNGILVCEALEVAYGKLEVVSSCIFIASVCFYIANK